MAAYSFFNQGAVPVLTDPTVALANIFLPFGLFALHNAASAGQKRLSSHTYLALNAAVVVNSICKLHDATLGFKVFTNPSFALGVATVALVSALVGLLRGATYKEK